MKERPIIFSGEMVRAILAGRKTQTRRVIKTIPCQCGVWLPYELSNTTPEGFQTIGHSGRWSCESCSNEAIKCPYGIPGDRLWCRESFSIIDHDFGEWDKSLGVPLSWLVFYYSNLSEKWRNPPIDELKSISKKYGTANTVGGPYDKKRPSIHMPRWASRITLEIKNIRVERVQDISEEDAKAEGVLPSLAWIGSENMKYRAAFAGLWNSINAKRGFGWDVNPWVWVAEFKKIETGKDG